MSLCEVNCQYIDYDFGAKQSLCECKVKLDFNSFSEIVFDKDIIWKYFIDINRITNIYTMKCINLLFSKEGLKRNIGSYILLIIIFLYIILVILFKTKEFSKLKKIIKDIVKVDKDENKKINKNLIKKRSSTNNKKTNKKKLQKPKIYKIKKIKNNPPKRMKGQNIKNIKSLTISNSIVNIYDKSISSSKKNKLPSIPPLLKYNDCEMNMLKYEDALKIDKRTFFEYYISLIKRKQIFIFTFYIKDDYNSVTIKLSLFLFLFALSYTINGLFFNDSTMHKIYEDAGSYDFIYQIPQIIYSSIISTSINMLFRLLALSENSILKLKGIKGKKIHKNLILKIKKCLFIKLIIYFLLSFLFLIFFWFYLSSFCAVYKNTQVHLIKDTIISFALSSLYPFGLSLLPGFLRIPSLKASKKDKEWMYIFSQIIQFI